MAFGETANLIAVLGLKDQFSGPLKNAHKSLAGFDAKLTDTQGRAYKAGQQIGTGIKNSATIAVGALGALTGLLVLSAKEGQDAAKVQNIYATAIANSGKVTAANVAALNAQQDALLNLTGTDDEIIKSQQTRLIQMGLTGDQALKLTPLIFDLAAAGYDLEGSTKAVAKAAQGNNTALQRLGIIVPKGADAIAILNERFKGTAASLSGGIDVRLKVLNERLANLREAAGQRLLPSLTKIVDVVAQKLVPAFGNLLDAILPSAIDGLNKLGDFLQGGGATSAITKMLDLARSAAPVIRDAAQGTLTVIQTAVGLFGSLPPEIQALAVAGLTINKLTGGLVTNIAGGLISAVISSFRGLMNVNAAVVNVNGPVGGLGGLGGAAATAGGVGLGVASAGILAAVAATVVGSAAVRGAVDNAIANSDVASLTAQAEAARKHGVSDSNNAALKALQAIVHNTASLALAAGASPAAQAQDDSEKAIMAKRSAFTSNPTRSELRNKIAILQDEKPSKANLRALHDLQNRLDNRIKQGNIISQARRIQTADESSNRKLTALQKLQADIKSHDAATARAIETKLDSIRLAIIAQQAAAQVGVVVKTILDGRTLAANLGRYTSTTTGSRSLVGTGPTSGSGI